ncbi:MAG: dynamin family protein [Planctomycetota bacterium]|nr:dynamin family protein [Planctomycetota bacterium]
MPQIRDFIQDAIQRRQAKVPRLQDIATAVEGLQTGLRRLSQLAEGVQGQDNLPKELCEAAATIPNVLRNVIEPLSRLQAKFLNLATRFRKPTLNVGVAGRARQGKSTLLRAITGLSEEVVPTAAGLPCTGAKSRILHQEQDPHALIEFFTENEFLREIVHAYYRHLAVRETNWPSSLEAFRSSKLPPLDDKIPERAAIHQKLRRLHEGLDALRPLLSHEPERVSLPEVWGYVAQRSREGTAPLYRYLAVRCANIFVQFPHPDVTGLALVDLPGLGELAQGHGEKIARSLQEEIDAVVLIKRPDGLGDHYTEADLKVLNLIQQAVPELDLSDWLFVVLNRLSDRSNSEIVELLRGSLPDIGARVEVLVADCSNSQEVEDGIFSVLLRHLRTHLDRIDAKYVKGLAADVEAIVTSISSGLVAVRQFLDTDQTGAGDYEKIRDLSTAFLTDLRVNLEELIDSFRRVGRDSEVEASFIAAVTEACDAADRESPVRDPRTLDRERANRGAWPGVIVEEMHRIRTSLTRLLADRLDGRLRAIVDGVLEGVYVRLTERPLDRLAALTSTADPKAHSRLGQFRQLVDTARYPNIADALDYLLAFSFAYQSHFHYRVRGAMDPFDPMGGGRKTLTELLPSGTGPEAAETVARGLTAIYREVVFEVRKVLTQKLHADPMRAIFALVEEFKDRLVRASGVDREWELFLHRRRYEIWPDVFVPFAQGARYREEWNSAIREVEGAQQSLRTLLEF